MMEQIAETGQAQVSSLFIRRSMYLAYFGQPPSTAGCRLDEELASHDVDMTEPDRVELSLALIRRGVNTESEVSSITSSVHDHQSRLQVSGEEARLNVLQELVTAEQNNLDEKKSRLV